MPTPSDIRAQILIQMKAEGMDVPARAAQEVEHLKLQINALSAELIAGNKTNKEYQDGMRALSGALNFWGKIASDAEAAHQKLDALAQRRVDTERKASAEIEATIIKAEMTLLDAEQKRIAQEEADAEGLLALQIRLEQEHIDHVMKGVAEEEKAKEELLAFQIRTGQEYLDEEMRRLVAEEKRHAKEKADAEELAAVRRKSAAEAEAEMIRADMLVEQHLAKQEAIAEKIRKVNAREGAGLSPTDALTRQTAAANREQEHLNDLIAEGASLQVDAAASIDKVTVAQRNKTFEVQRDADGMTKYVQVANAAASANRGGAGAMDEGTKSSRAFGYGLLNIAHAAQDAQYGFGALLNNIPLVVQAVGGGPGLAGTVMIAGVAFESLKGHVKQFGIEIGAIEDPAKKAAYSIEDLKKRIEAIKEKPYKVQLDFEMIRDAEERIAALEKRLSAFKSAVGDVTDVQEKVARSVKKAISEEAGGTDDQSGAENLLNLIKLTKQKEGPEAFVAGHPEFVKWKAEGPAREELKRLEAMKPESLDEAAAIRQRRLDLETMISTSMEKMTRETEDAAKAMIGDALLGRAKGIDYILDFLDSQEFKQQKDRVFEKGGALVGPLGRKTEVAPVSPIFRAALDQSRAEEVKRVEEEEKQDVRDEAKRQGRDFRRKLANDRIDKLKALEGDAPGDLQRMRDASINKDISTFGADKAHGGVIEGEATGLAAKGLGPMEIRKALLGPELARLGAAGVDAKLRDAVARGIINNITDKVMAELTAAGPNIAANARAAIEAGAAKDGAREAAAGKRAAAAGGKQDARARTLSIAGQIGQEFHGIGQEFGANISDAQAMQGAEMYQKMVKGGTHPDVARDRVFAKMNQLIAEQLRAMAMLNGGNAEMERTLEGALDRMRMLTQQAQMIEGRVGNMRAKGAIVPNTIPVRRR